MCGVNRLCNSGGVRQVGVVASGVVFGPLGFRAVQGLGGHQVLFVVVVRLGVFDLFVRIHYVWSTLVV